jgi:hypothetical protein
MLYTEDTKASACFLGLSDQLNSVSAILYFVLRLIFVLPCREFVSESTFASEAPDPNH